MNRHGAVILSEADDRAAQFAKIRSRFHDKELANLAELAYDLEAKQYALGFVQVLNYPFLNVAPVAVNSFTSTTSLMSPAPTPYIPANAINVGTRFRMRCWGSIASAAGTATFTFGASIGNTLPGTAVCAGAAGTPATGPLPLWLEFELTCLVTGAASTASIIGQGIQLGGTATPTTPVLLPATAPTALVTTWATTNANAITPASVCSVSAAGNSVLLYGATVEQLN